MTALDPDQLQVLQLTSRYEPHSLISWQQAICLLVTNKVDVLDEYEAKVSSPSVTLSVPAVVRLRKDVGSSAKSIKFSRANVLRRDKYICCYCGKKKKPRELEFDHVVPRSRWTGPKHKITWWENIVSACRPCNRLKDDRTPHEAGLRMHYKPVVPAHLPMTQPILMDVDRMPPQWAPYLRGEVVVA